MISSTFDFIDLFCGIGGLAEGASSAGGRAVFAANHWRAACDHYYLNHGLLPACQDVRQMNWTALPKFDVFLAAPACQGHSKARGPEKPHHDELRMTAWAVIDCLECNRPEFGIIENVVEFLDWGLYPLWKSALEKLGYAVSPHVIDAADCGVPQNRERVFILISRSKAPIKLELPKMPHVPVDSVIDWGEKYTWSTIERGGARPRAEATLKRVASGRKRHGERFLAPFYGTGSGETGRSIQRPCGTLTTKDRWAVIRGDQMRVLQPAEQAAIMGMRSDIILPKTKTVATKMLGNAVCPEVPRQLLNTLRSQA